MNKYVKIRDIEKMIDIWVTNPFSSSFSSDCQRYNIEEQFITSYSNENSENGLKLL
jgi:hypothetical protein